MKNNIKDVLQPNFYKEFSCIGAACESTCCANWNIHIDRDTYNKYRTCKHKELGPKINESIVRNRREGASDAAYGVIKLKDKECPFWINGLCELQLELGEEYLCDVCKTHPRIVNGYADQAERTLDNVCPETIRMLMKQKEPITFEKVIAEDNLKVFGRFFTKAEVQRKDIYWQVRSVSIDIMQDRKYKIWERLIILGIFLNSLTRKYDTSEHASEILTFSDNFKKQLANTHMNFDDIKSNPEIEFDIVKTFLLTKFSTGLMRNAFLDIIVKVIKIYGLDTEKITNEESTKIYSELKNKYYEDFMKENDYRIENYLVNYMFGIGFPLNKNLDFMDSYNVLIAHYTLLKFCIIGLLGHYNGKISDEVLKDLLYSYARVTMHSKKYSEDLKKIMESNNIDSLAFMAMILKE